MEKMINKNTPAWRFQVWASFAISISSMVFGIYRIHLDWWTKGYLMIGLFFLVSSCFALAKTIRDDLDTK